VIVLLKERLYPVVDVIWDIQLRHLVHQSLMPDGVERLCKVIVLIKSLYRHLYFSTLLI